MWKALVSVTRIVSRPNLSKCATIIQQITPKQALVSPSVRNFTLLSALKPQSQLLLHPKVQEIADTTTRGLTKYSYNKGKRKSVKAVLKRFYRLDWGGWIRTKCGRHKKLWKKKLARQRRLRQHVLCNAQQSMLLDKMVGSYWRKPKYYPEDPYNPYHKRDEFALASRRPRPYFPPENRIET